MEVGTRESLEGAMANEGIDWNEHDQETVGGVLDITASRARIFDFIINGPTKLMQSQLKTDAFERV